MSRRKGDQVAVQLDVRDDDQWLQALGRSGLTVADFYTAWCGPCIALQDTLKKVKFEVGEDRLHLITACTDTIEALADFRLRSEVLWVFFSGGLPVYMQRGANSVLLTKMILHHLELEKKIENGEAERCPVELVCDPPKAIVVNLLSSGQSGENGDSTGQEDTINQIIRLHSVLAVSMSLLDSIEVILSYLSEAQFSLVEEKTIPLSEMEQITEVLSPDVAKTEDTETSPDPTEDVIPLLSQVILDNFCSNGVKFLVFKDCKENADTFSEQSRWQKEVLVTQPSGEETDGELQPKLADEADLSVQPLLERISAALADQDANNHIWTPETPELQEKLLRKLFPDLISTLTKEGATEAETIIFALLSADTDVSACQGLSSQVVPATPSSSDPEEAAPQTQADSTTVLYSGSGELDDKILTELNLSEQVEDKITLQALVVRTSDAKQIAENLAALSPIYLSIESDKAKYDVQLVLSRWGVDTEFLQPKIPNEQDQTSAENSQQ